jgi:hypothetical protein
MTDLLSDDTDFEISKYYEARDMIDAGINPAIEKNKKSVFNPETGMNDVLLPMSSGGYVKISEEAPEVMTEAPAQPTMPGASDVAPAQAAVEEAKINYRKWADILALKICLPLDLRMNKSELLAWTFYQCLCSHQNRKQIR